MGIFSERLHIAHGVTAIIGSGGKTSLMYRLADELSEYGTVIITTTTHIFRPMHLPFAETAERVDGILCLGTPCDNGKIAAPRQSFAELQKLADFVLVEADGAAGKPLKAHASHEPVIPAEANQTITVVGASGIGRKTLEAVHRPQIFSTLAGGAELASAEAIACVLTAEAFSTRVLINQADSAERLRAALELAERLPCPVLIASLQKGEIRC